MDKGFIFYFLVLFGQTMSDDRCSFTISNSTEKISEFRTLINSGIKMVYVDIFISNDEGYTNSSKYNIKLESGLLRWVWSKNEISFLLSYTEDIHAISFNLLKGVYIDDFAINIVISPQECVFVYRNDTESLFDLIHDSFVKNESDWLLCHRYFENQQWKVTFFNLTSYWLGYGMECFQPSCRTKFSKCESFIEKSFVNYLIVLFLLGTFLYSPILFYFFPEKVQVNNIERRFNHYNSFDTPYSLSRLLLNLNKQPYTFPKHAFGLSYLFSQENQVLTILVIISTIINISHKQLNTIFIRDLDKYEHLYLEDSFSIEYLGDSIASYLLIFFCIVGVFAVSISVQILILRNIKNIYFIYFLWTKKVVKYVDIEKLIDCDEHVGYDPHGYKIFVIAILNRVALLFSSKFYLSLFKPVCTKLEGSKLKRFLKFVSLLTLTLLNFIFNINMCAFPILYFAFAPMLFICFATKIDIIKKMLALMFGIIVILSVVMVFRFLFIAALSVFIRFVIYNVFIIFPIYELSFKFWTIVITTFSYLRIFYKDFYAPYNELLKQCISYSNEYNMYKMKIVPIRKYCKIANIIFPIRMQIAFLLGKILFLTFIITVIVQIMNYNVGNENFIDQYLPLILFTVTPAVAMKLHSSDPKEDVEKCKVLIKDVMSSTDQTDETENVSQNEDNCVKRIRDLYKKSDRCKCIVYVLVACLLPVSFYAMVFLVFFSIIKSCFSCTCKFNDKDLEDKALKFRCDTFHNVEPRNDSSINDNNSSRNDNDSSSNDTDSSSRHNQSNRNDELYNIEIPPIYRV